MKETIRQFWDKIPLWAKMVVVLLGALCATITTSLATSCGPATKVVTRTDNKSSVNISISQPSTNDTDVNVDAKPEVNVQPTLTGYKYTISNF